MEVCEARARSFLLGSSRGFRSSLLAYERALLPYIFQPVPLRSAFKINVQLGVHNFLLKSSPTVSARKDISSQEFCEVLWTVEADLADGQILYVTGDPITLGCWEPVMAIRMLPSSERPNLWKTEVKVPCGANFKYNYFIRGDKWPSSDVTWRPGPEFSVSIPLPSKQHNRKVVVRDLWMEVQIGKIQVLSWGSWIEETNLTADQVIPSPNEGKHRNLRSQKIVRDSSLSPIEFVEDEPYSLGRNDLNILSNNIIASGGSLFERDQPVEEPWLLQSALSFKDEIDSSSKRQSNEEVLKQRELPNKSYQGTEIPEDASKLTSFEDSVSTVILINSSICTMQRIAVMEEGKLVELLLEPVKNNVHCDSVYLGVVTRLVPHMGGAFVNIGISRPSLMDIKQNREPFIFPPFRRKGKEKEVNGAVIHKHKQHSDIFSSSSHGVEVTDDIEGIEFKDDPDQFSHEDFEEHEADDEFDANVNGSIVDYDDADGDADFEDDFDGNGPGPEGESENINGVLPVLRGSHASQHSEHTLHDIKDSGGAHHTVDKWNRVRKGTKVIVQVVKEGLGTKGPALTAYPNLRSRFWILITRCERIGVSKKVSGVERTRLRVIAKTLQPPGFGLTVRTVAAGHSLEELQKDLEGLLSTWKDIMEHAKSAALAADEGVEGAVPVILHRAMGQTLSVAQDYFNEKVDNMVVDSPRTYHEVTSYLQDIAPDLCDRVELYNKRIPIFDEYGIEEEIDNMLSKRVPLVTGGSLVIEQTEALVSIDVNGGHGMLGQESSQERAILDVNLAAAKQIARELRLRDIGGIIVVDFIDMVDDSNKRMVYEEIKKAVDRDRSIVKVSELSRHGLMEITRKRVRPSVTFMISEPCICCHGTGRVEALETSFSKIEHEICRLLASSNVKGNLENPKSWPRFVLMVDRYMCNYLTSGKRTRLALLSSSLKVWLLLKVARGFTRGSFEVKPFVEEKENTNQNRAAAISRLRPTEAGTKVTLFPVKKWKSSRK
ncbi:ribonuclease E/G-like protein, chloroplastic [Papaver somniferum]|uniref:ribonuclease E/G-like protein, chloroplastic n=1 Tax=Papaver somniferum TaxID=3469 RepID=UPI000E6F55DE|nr:ribonuclease E/G-like protein, chloroplastic [Papaver somniferum]